MQRILFCHTAGFAAGIIFGYVFNIPLGIALILAFFSGIFAITGLYLNRWSLMPLLFSLAVGIWWGQVRVMEVAEFPFPEGEQVEVRGMVTGEPATTATGRSFPLQADEINGRKFSGRINIIADKGPVIRYGDVLTIRGKVLKDSVASNPCQYDFSSHLKRVGIVAAVSTMYGGEIRFTGENRGNLLLKGALALKRKMLLVLEELPGRQGAFIGGMLFGDKGNLTYEERNVLSQTGLMDAFAVSGVHVGFVVLFALALAEMIGCGKMGRLILLSTAVIFYAAMSGFTPSVLRAGFMAILGSWAYLLREEKDFFTALALVALILLVANPATVFDPGFQLSFCAAGGVVYLFPVISSWVPSGGRLWQGLAAALAAHLAIWPLVIYYFNVMTVYGLVVSLVTTLPVGAVVILGLSSTLLSLVSTGLAVLPAYGAGVLVELIWQMARWVSSLPGAYLTVKTPSFIVLLVYYSVLLFFPYLNRKTSGQPFTIAAAGFLILVLAWPASGDRLLHVNFIDVGQGDCIYVQSPGGRRVLIDGGGRSFTAGLDVGERIVIPYLHSMGINRLDLVINSHPHDDHLKGLQAVINEIDVGGIVVAQQFLKLPELKAFLGRAGEKRIPVHSVHRGDKIVLEPGVEFLVLHPEPERKAREDLNNDSLVLRLSFRDVSVIFTGDAEEEVLSLIAGGSNPVAAQVLKISHHGSKGGLYPDFFRKVGPELVVICVGTNTFGHPSGEVLRYWEEHNIPVYRTDRHGAVLITTDGYKIIVDTVKNPQNEMPEVSYFTGKNPAANLTMGL